MHANNICIPGMSVGWDVKWYPVSRITTLGTQKTVSLDFVEELAREGRQGNLKNS